MQRTRQFVDDLAQGNRGEQAEVIGTVGPAALTVAQGFEELHLTPSKKKSIIVSSARDVAKGIETMLKSHGYHLTIANDVKDLGMDTACGKKRVTRVLKSRIVKAGGRSKQVRVLANFTRRASKLFTANLWPVST